ncbi:hypothetical protein LCGC14_0258890 [marine sediment metagenome]|uniref:Uncharacterized protein n=1 Tax=marine sediment metagenome TaxID=412755 RepID=A0A0F9U757_9ZZZZ
MSVTIYEEFGSGGANLVPGGAGGAPTLAEALRQTADDLAALKARGDTAMQTQLDLVTVQQTAIRTAVDAAVGKVNAHLAMSGSHVAADVDNPIASPAATDPTADILLLVNDAYDMMLAHMAMDAGGAGVHPGGADTTNLITATYPATTEAEAVALHNDIHAQYTQHIANNGAAYHTNADVTNTYTEGAASDWDDLVATANGFKDTTGFNQHVILTAGPTHGATDVAHVITAPDCGVQITALWLEINEFQTDYNAHVAHLGVHPNAGTADATAVATTEATAVALLTALIPVLNAHMTNANDHLDADATTAQVAGAATEYEDIIVVTTEFRASHVAHLAQGPALHHRVDGTNTASAIGAGGDVTVLGTGGAAAIGLLKG